MATNSLSVAEYFFSAELSDLLIYSIGCQLPELCCYSNTLPIAKALASHTIRVGSCESNTFKTGVQHSSYFNISNDYY